MCREEPQPSCLNAFGQRSLSEAGVSIVLELPVCWATGSAEYFAVGAVSLLERLGCVDAICFGSECGDFSLLDEIAKVTADEPQEYQFSLQEGLRNGMSFPLARQMALKAYFKDDRLDLILEQPNNILGIEYLKALHRNNSPMKAYTIQRKVSGYHDTQLSESCSQPPPYEDFWNLPAILFIWNLTVFLTSLHYQRQ